MNIPIQPTGLKEYVGTIPMVIPHTLKRLFYTSWEDALWDIMKAKKIKKGSIVLVPEFFCGDVVVNMRRHGLHPVWYPCDRNFQTDPQVFKQELDKHKPALIVLFHAVGITNTLFSTYDVWKKSLLGSTIIVEDAVHRIVDPQKINLLQENHVIIDSLRKVSPLQGSNLYGSVDFMTFKQTKSLRTIPYSFFILIASIAFQCLLHLTVFFKEQRIGKLFNLMAERVMVTVYRLIGNSHHSSPGIGIFNYLSMRLKIDAIESCKKKQVQKYRRDLSGIWNSPDFFQIHIPKTDEAFLRGFPVGLTHPNASHIRRFLRKQGLLMLFELNDSPWSKHQKVVYLPLGPHVSDRDMEFVIFLLKKSMSV